VKCSKFAIEGVDRGRDLWYSVDILPNNGMVAKILFQPPLPLSKIIPEVKRKSKGFSKKVEIFNIS
jgi:hypothetical protein